MDEGPHGLWVIAITLAFAMVLAVLPLPQWLIWGRPEWVALALIYWVIALPHRVGLFSALLVGVSLDVMEGAVLGQNALSLVIVAALSLVLYQRLRLFNVWQQAGVVFVLIGINQLVCQWVENFTGAGARSALFMLPALSSALLWPFVLHSLRGLRRYYEVT